MPASSGLPRGLRGVSGAFATLWRLLPVDCLLCGRSGRYRDNLCPDCSAALPAMVDPCPGCGLLVQARPAGSLCGRCLVTARQFDFCRGPFHYRPPVSNLITGLKFHARLDHGLALSALLAETIWDFYGDGVRPQLIVPVPLHRRRQCQRGFNQAQEIARVVARRCAIPVADCVERVRNTAPQTEQPSLAARRSNLGRAFRVHKPRRLENVTHIILIDDVVTSMATANALGRCLRAQGIRRIDVWCVARASR